MKQLEFTFYPKFANNPTVPENIWPLPLNSFNFMKEAPEISAEIFLLLLTVCENDDTGQWQ